MKLNPVVQKNALLLLATAVAGPALVVSGARYPGTMGMKLFLVATGVGVSGFSFMYLKEDMNKLLPGPVDDV